MRHAQAAIRATPNALPPAPFTRQHYSVPEKRFMRHAMVKTTYDVPSCLRAAFTRFTCRYAQRDAEHAAGEA